MLLGNLLHYIQAKQASQKAKPKQKSPSKPVLITPSSPKHSQTATTKPLAVKKKRHSTSSVDEDTKSTALDWNSWPDGFLELDLTYEEYRETKELETHWANISTGGDRRGQYHADEWQKGKRLTRTCLGIISCENSECRIVIRPHIKPAYLHHQLSKTCKCGHDLVHTQCGIRSYIYQRADGQAEFKRLVTSYPNSGPLQLLTGVPTLTRPGQSAADIAKPFTNAHRIGKGRLKIKKEANLGSDGLIAAFAAFNKEYPSFVRSSSIGEITVISVQTSFMQSQLLKDYALDGQLNGLVSDAAHGWWKQHTSLLIVSSVYCPFCHMWVPGMLTYSNGASAQHFECHFLVLFESIAEEASDREMEVTNDLFVGVADAIFSLQPLYIV
ncbi:hypothetical protein CPC08DRAFT_648858 [Agrocybe pediades]|nr:hypothetical protein CPC08DRAFT_648858 [Agrocybe pediades]